MVNIQHCTFEEFKKQHPETTGYYKRAFEDIPGFYKSGDSMYGDCDDMIVRSWDALHDDCFVVYLSNFKKAETPAAGTVGESNQLENIIHS